MVERVTLYFPEGHWALDLPQKDRAKKVKEILESAHDIVDLKNDIADIKKILMSGGNYTPSPPVPSKDMEDADKELIMSFMGM